jgi:hypothetical protein
VSGTELSRVMAEVTAQPPVDVDFAAVMRTVRRRRVQRQGVAAFAAALVAAVAIVVPVALSGSGTSAEKGPAVAGTPTPVSTPTSARASAPPADSSWRKTSRNGLSWRTPPGWRVLNVKPVTHSEPAGAANSLAVLSTFPVGSKCSVPDVSRCLLKLPDDGVFARVIAGGGYGQVVGQDSGTLTAAKDECKAMGAARSFTSMRTFGTAPYTIDVQVSGCLGEDALNTGPTLLRALVASLADPNAVTVDASWHQVSAGRLQLLVAPDWRTDQEAESAQMVLDTSCPRTHTALDGWTCAPPIPDLHPTQGFVWISALAPTGSPLAKSKYYGSQPATGACAAAGGAEEYLDQRDLGPKDAGESLVISGCLGGGVSQRSYQEITLSLNRITDTRYADPQTLCASVPGTTISTELATIGEIRALTWDGSQPAASVFPDAAVGDQAAWCWVRDDTTAQYDVWAAHQGDPAVKLVSLTTAAYGAGFTPSGAPYSPPPASLAPVGHAGAGTDADALCTSILGSHVSAWPDTVGDIRHTTWAPPNGTGKPPLAGAFPGVGGLDAVAWCWQDHDGTYTDYVVHAGDKPVVAAITKNVPAGSVPAGPPLFP